jgi:hypothetical protein
MIKSGAKTLIFNLFSSLLIAIDLDFTKFGIKNQGKIWFTGKKNLHKLYFLYKFKSFSGAATTGWIPRRLRQAPLKFFQIFRRLRQRH